MLGRVSVPFIVVVVGEVEYVRRGWSRWSGEYNRGGIRSGGYVGAGGHWVVGEGDYGALRDLPVHVL